MSKLFTYLLLVHALLSFKAYAQVGLSQENIELKKYLDLIKNAQYTEAIEALKSIEEKNLPQEQRAYYNGVAFSRLQQFDEAILQFKMAIKNNCSFKDIHYEYGQALFGNNQIKAARDAFKLSFGLGFNPIPSLYYVAHTSELLEEFNIAKFYYAKIIKDQRTDKKMLQVAFYQYTKILLDLMRKEDIKLRKFDLEDLSMRNIPRYIIPLLNKTISVDPNSEIANEANQLVQQLNKEFFLDPNLLLNGKKMPSTRYYSYLSLRTKYDNNYASTKRGATSYEGTFYYKYDFTAKKRFIISPDIRLDVTKYKNQTEPLFYEYDSYSISSSLRNRYEHRLFNKQASLALTLDYAKNYRDLDGNHQQKPAYQTYSYALGETFNFFPVGDTSFKIKNSNYVDALDSTSNSKTFSASIDQSAFLNQGQNLLLASFDLSITDNYNYTFTNYKNYSLRLTYLYFEIIPSYTLQLSHTFSVTDPQKLREDRGYELSYNPSIEINKQLTSSISLIGNASFYSSKSKNEAYRSDKSTLSFELSVTF